MKRVMEAGEWTLFSPSDVPDLHDKFGKAFEEAYTVYEKKAARGELKLFKKIPALTLWRKMLTMLFETGHPWITFKDPCNIRSPQQHVGVVHSSNLCTEITLNTNAEEIAVCNLGSVNLLNHLTDDGRGGKMLDHAKLKKTIATAMRMLDNVIDINYYAVKKARDSNFKHRPVGLGIMGFQDCLQELRIPYASDACGGLRRPLDGSRVLLRVLGLHRARRGARPLLQLRRLALGQGHPPARHAEAAARGARRLRRSGHVRVDGLGQAARAHQGARHAQLQLRGHRAHRDHQQHHRRVGLDRAELPEPLREVEPLGRVHGGERVPGARPQEAEPVGQRDGRRPEALRRLHRQDRPHPAGGAQTSTPPRSRWTRAGWWKRRRAARSGSTRRSR